ncbi:MAG TPA: DUF5750 family protein [Methanobacterium sp.]|nr:DUF5750 family protein [Methanobacterium sp.]
MNRLNVKIREYGYSEEYNSYYVTYQVSDLDKNALKKLEERLEDPLMVKKDDLFLTVYFDEKFYPFKSEESQINPSDFLAREELEMTAYLVDLLED